MCWKVGTSSLPIRDFHPASHPAPGPIHDPGARPGPDGHTTIYILMSHVELTEPLSSFLCWDCVSSFHVCLFLFPSRLNLYDMYLVQLANFAAAAEQRGVACAQGTVAHVAINGMASNSFYSWDKLSLCLSSETMSLISTTIRTLGRVFPKHRYKSRSMKANCWFERGKRWFS